jgi:Flp pilus assembly protein TadG
MSMRRMNLFHLAGRLAKNRDAGTATEFAICGLAYFAFMLGIVNLGMAGISLGALSRGVQQAGRMAAVQAASNYAASSPGVFTCPAPAVVATYFNNAVNPPLPSAGTNASTSNPYINAVWTDNDSSTAGASNAATEPPGVYVTLTASYRWKPIGFNVFGNGLVLKITTVATVPGSSAVASSSVDGSC